MSLEPCWQIGFFSVLLYLAIMTIDLLLLRVDADAFIYKNATTFFTLSVIFLLGNVLLFVVLTALILIRIVILICSLLTYEWCFTVYDNRNYLINTVHYVFYFCALVIPVIPIIKNWTW